MWCISISLNNGLFEYVIVRMCVVYPSAHEQTRLYNVCVLYS